MPDLLDFLPIANETLASIRARLDADVNAGLDPDDPGFLDTTVGGFYWDLSQIVALEIERLWDFASTDVPAAAFPAFAWGEYLDEHGEAIGVARKAAIKATGKVTFSGTNGTLVPIGTEVQTAAASADDEPVSFLTTASGSIAGGVVELAVEAAEAGSVGNVAIGAVDFLLSPITGVTTVNNAAAISGGTDVESDEAYQARLLLELSAVQGAGSQGDYRRWALAWPGVGFVRVVPLWAGAGTVRVIVTDPANDPVVPAVRDGLQNDLDPFEAQSKLNGAHTLPDAIIDVDSTAGFAAAGRVRISDQVVNYTGKTATTLTGCTGGAGTFPDDTAVVQGGMGRGRAPVGALVTVDTPASLAVTVEAWLDLEAGYSLDGAGGTIAVRADAEQALRDYVDALSPSDDVILPRVESRFFRVRGVRDVRAETKLNGSHALPQVTITVDSTDGFATAGKIQVGGQVITYTGKTGTTFTGCTGGTGAYPDDALVEQSTLVNGAAADLAVADLQVPSLTTITLAEV